MTALHLDVMKAIGEGRLIGRDMANPPDTLEDLEL